MAYYEGETLRERIARGPLPLDDAIDVATQVGQGLAEAHGEGIVHRDIKPANLLVTKSGVVKILDFGLAKLAGSEGVTQTGTTVGTVAYMSPEQARGEEVDHRTDIWSLGVVLYEMLTAQQPFQGDNLLAISKAILDSPAPSLTGEAAALNGVVVRALRKSEASRCQAVTELLDDLRRATASPGRATSRREVPSIAVLPFTNMSADPEQDYFSDGLTEEIIADLSQIRDLRVISRTSVMQLKGTEKDLKTIGRELGVRYVLEGSVRKAGNNLRITAQLIDAPTDTHLWADKYGGTLDDVFDIQERVSRAIVDGLKIRLSPEEDRRVSTKPIADLTAYECYLKARQEIWLGSSEALDRALALIDRGLDIVGDNDQLYAAKSFALTQCVNALVRPPESFAELIEQSQQCAARALALNPSSAPAHVSQGFVCAQRGDPQGALRHWREAVRLDPNRADAHFMLGYWLLAGGRDVDAGRRHCETFRQLDPLNSLVHISPGIIHMFQGEFSAAVEAVRAAQQAAERDGSPWLFLFAWLHAASGDLREADRVTDALARHDPGHVLVELMSFARYAWHGERQPALDTVTERLEKAAWWDDIYPLLMAEAYALVGEAERALYWLDHAIGYGIANVRFLQQYDPFLANLRTDERFERLISKARDVSASLHG